MYIFFLVFLMIGCMAIAIMLALFVYSEFKGESIARGINIIGGSVMACCFAGFAHFFLLEIIGYLSKL